jgi:N utilization substance protein B
VINEALEIAKKFSTDEAVPYINGVLDAIRKELDASAKSSTT